MASRRAAAAWALSVLLGLPADLAVGVILVGCCPGGTASNVITYIAGGDVSLSAGMTIVSTLLAPIMTPLLTYLLAGAWVDVSLVAMIISVVKVILVPVLLGMGLGLLAAKLFKVEYDKATAISIEVGMQNSGLAVSLAAANFAANPLATLPGAIFSVWHNISGSIFASIRRMGAERKEKVSVEQ